jgi:hypothetical protein
MDAADAVTWRFYGRQKLQDCAEPVADFPAQMPERPLRSLVTARTGYRCRKGRINEAEKRWPGVKAYLNATGLGSDPKLIKQLVARAERRPDRR